MLHTAEVASRAAWLNRLGSAPAVPAFRPFAVRVNVIARRSAAESSSKDIAPAMPRDVVRLVAAITIGLNIALSLIDVWRIVFWPVPVDALRIAAVAAAFAIPLHIRHVVFGLRGQRPPAGAWT